MLNPHLESFFSLCKIVLVAKELHEFNPTQMDAIIQKGCELAGLAPESPVLKQSVFEFKFKEIESLEESQKKDALEKKKIEIKSLEKSLNDIVAEIEKNNPDASVKSNVQNAIAYVSVTAELLTTEHSFTEDMKTFLPKYEEIVKATTSLEQRAQLLNAHRLLLKMNNQFASITVNDVFEDFFKLEAPEMKFYKYKSYKVITAITNMIEKDFSIYLKEVLLPFVKEYSQNKKIALQVIKEKNLERLGSFENEFSKPMQRGSRYLMTFSEFNKYVKKVYSENIYDLLLKPVMNASEEILKEVLAESNQLINTCLPLDLKERENLTAKYPVTMALIFSVEQFVLDQEEKSSKMQTQPEKSFFGSFSSLFSSKSEQGAEIDLSSVKKTLEQMCIALKGRKDFNDGKFFEEMKLKMIDALKFIQFKYPKHSCVVPIEKMIEKFEQLGETFPEVQTHSKATL